MTATADPGRRAALIATKLRALVAAAPGDDPAVSGAGAGLHAAEVLAYAGGAALRVPGSTWVLTESAVTAGPGAALAWAGRSGSGGTGRLHLVLDGDAATRAGVVARRATLFDPAPAVWRVRGRHLVAVVPEAPPAAGPPGPAALALVPELRAAGLDVVVEHGVVRGEVDGLEVAVVVVDGDGRARIEVGVGRNDREAFALLHGDLPPAAALARVAGTVRRHRRPGAPPHPLNRMAPARWLRARLLRGDEPATGWRLEPVPAPEPRAGVADDGPAFAGGVDGAGRAVLVACSVGVDLELAPAAADARAAHEPEARLVLAVPARDDHPATRRLAAALRRPADVVVVGDDWRR